MIDRYSTEQMRQVWSDENRLKQMTLVEIAALEVLTVDGVVPGEALQQIVANAHATPEEVREKEQETKHETAAFVAVLGDSAGDAGRRWVHYGLTSSDVVDTGMALQVKQAGDLVLTAAHRLAESLRYLAAEHAATPVMARTHGRNAQPTTFGYRVAGWLAEFDRGVGRFSEALQEMRAGKLSGPVGTRPVLTTDQESRALSRIGLYPETYATQVVSRDRYASLLAAMSLLAGSVERIAENVRLASQSGVDEVSEGRTDGQQGSSAMPHKVNPVRSERVVGLSRLLRAYAFALMQNQALWQERDLTHSSVERVVLPDSFALLEFAINECAAVMTGLNVNSHRMEREAYGTEAQSGLLLNAMVRHGFARQFAHAALTGAVARLSAGSTSLAECLIEELDEDATGAVAQALFAAVDVEEEVRRASALVERSTR